ncbi:MAG: hypothetical protein NC079_00595 [Clostridium sp.]|nr:hypothetical protein [Acetatifactor muris]MCM1527465.1 hypothetical protein [Bacteroides sp.]MCM1562089.1 hypothetical protein [Clostridium sp.]
MMGSENQIDELKLYRGDDLRINEHISIRQPTLREICEYGETEYFHMVRMMCSVGADLKWQLDDMGIDYTRISDFELFTSLLSAQLPRKSTAILLGDSMDLSQMQPTYDENLKEVILAPQSGPDRQPRIDRYVYNALVTAVRKMHRLRRNEEVPGNEATRRILIEEARENYEQSKGMTPHSYLLPLISAMVNSEGFKQDHHTVFDMKIYPFMDSVQRIERIKNATLLLQSGYSGFGVNLNRIDKDALNWMGELK